MACPLTKEELTALLAGEGNDAAIGAAICPGDPVDPGIARYVAALTAAGIETYEACEGGAGHGYRVPSVRFHGGRSAGMHALGVCFDHGLPVFDLSRVWDVQDGEVVGPTWMLTFSERSDAWAARPARGRGLTP